MAKLKLLESSGHEEVDAYIADRFTKPERAKLLTMKEEALAPGPISPNCKLVINIPAFHAEKNLEKTLLKYLDQTGGKHGNEFEIVILVNGPMGVNLTESAAYQQAAAVMKRFPELKINLIHGNFTDSELKIGSLRKYLGAYSLDRAATGEGVDVENLVLVTHDADLQDIHEDYIDGTIGAFEENPELGALTGFIDYPQEDFYQDHLFLAVQRFNDILETLRRYKLDITVFRGGNSCFRARDYMEAGGHPRSKKRENTPLYQRIKKKGEHTTHFDRHATTITTSARRQIMAISEGVPLADRYDTFGESGDLAEKYQVPPSELVIPERVHKITSPDFADLLREELQSILNRELEGETGNKEGSLERMKKFMKRAGFFLGIKIDFEGDKVILQDISKLKEKILKKYSHF